MRILLGLIGLLVCIIHISNCDDKSGTITMQDYVTGRYNAAGFGATWVSDNEIQYRTGGKLIKRNILTNLTVDVLDENLFNDLYPGGRVLTLSADGIYVLVEFERKNDVANRIWGNISPTDFAEIWHSDRSRHPEQCLNGSQKILPKGSLARGCVKINPAGIGNENAILQLVRWAPTGHSLVFVYRGNLFYMPTNSFEIRQLTFDPENTVLNGHADWVYEEEMFGSSNALWFSPDSNHLAFIRFDDSNVKKFTYPMYGEAGIRETNYPNMITVDYPKAGETNPTTEMFIVNLLTQGENPKPIQYPANFDKTTKGHYFGSAIWPSGSDSVIISHLNRHQNEINWLACKPNVIANPTCTLEYGYTEPNYWIDVPRLTVSRDGDQFLYISGHSDLKHRQIIHVNQNGLASTINSSNLSVNSILGWDETNGKIYFQATGMNSDEPDPSQTQIYSIVLATPTTQVICLTCIHENVDGHLCGANSAAFSTAFTHYTHTCSGPEIPSTYLRKTQNGEIMEVLADNQALKNRFESDGVSIPEYRDFTLEMPHSYPAKARLFLPHDFDQNKKYPLIIDVYGGPGSKSIGQGYGVSWGTSLVSDKGIIYGYIDGRGSAGQTVDHLAQIYRRMGTVEIEDQMQALHELMKQNSWIDSTKTAIWGWSYGGYATAMVMKTDTSNIYKCGISVAPVTSWLYYDTIYTERYMGLPTVEDNWASYNSSQATTGLENFRQKKFFLVHGNADDNVHYQQSMIMSRALEQNDIMFYQLSYPDEAHSINGPGMRTHLYHSLEKFLFEECFEGFTKGGSSGAALFTINGFLLTVLMFNYLF